MTLRAPRSRTRRIPIVGIFAALVITFAIGSGQAWAQGGTCGPTSAGISSALSLGATRLASLQLPDAGWGWTLSSTTSPANQFGVEGLGLLDTQARTGDAALLVAAIRTGDALVARYNSQIPKQRAYTTDVEFLVALGTVTGNTTYSTTAVAWFGVTMSQYPAPASRVDAILTGRGLQGYRTMAAWDVASLIRAAKSVGQTAYAIGAATRIVQRELTIVEGATILPGWKDTDPAHRWDQCAAYGCGFPGNLYSFDYTILGEGALLEALHGLPGFDAVVAEYKAFLIAQQDPGGSWDVGDTQITAFALRGLASTGDLAAKPAIAQGTCFFLAQQFANGGWPVYEGAAESDENTEVDAETLSALAMVRVPVVTVTGGTFTYDGSSHDATAVAVGEGGSPVAGNFSFTYAPGGPAAPVVPGVYAVAASFTSTSGDYLDATGDGSIVVEKAGTTTLVSCPANVAYTGSALTPCSATVTGPGGLNESVPVVYSNNTNVGTANATAIYAGTDLYNTSTGLTSFAIDKANTTTTVSCPANATYTGSALTPCSATVTGPGGLSQPLTVSYANNTNPGTATATATYAGASQYNGSTDSKTFAIGDPATPGEMTGDGFVVKDHAKYHFNFFVGEGVRHAPRNRFSLRIDYEGVWGRNSWYWPTFTKRPDDSFVATSINLIAFSDDQGFRPGRSPRPQVDTVLFSGLGRWNGQPGYRFEVRATDQGEPGRRHEMVTITITRIADNAVVASVSDYLTGGNIESVRLKH